MEKIPFWYHFGIFMLIFIFYRYLVYSLSGEFGVIFSVLVYCTKKNPATQVTFEQGQWLLCNCLFWILPMYIPRISDLWTRITSLCPSQSDCDFHVYFARLGHEKATWTVPPALKNCQYSFLHWRKLKRLASRTRRFQSKCPSVNIVPKFQ
jgi:hypothetical protein